MRRVAVGRRPEVGGVEGIVYELVADVERWLRLPAWESSVFEGIEFPGGKDGAVVADEAITGALIPSENRLDTLKASD